MGRNDNDTAELIPDKNSMRIDISDDERYTKFMGDILKIWSSQKKRFSLSSSSWKEQFEEACDPPRDPTALDFFLHSISFPWKLLFACIPPTDYYGGWVTFVTSLIATGGVTVFIEDLATSFGCHIGLTKPILAITIVALGTSMPDTFASRTATMMAPDADAAVGNVTGSNSVNVFLGLGLPWCIASFYQVANGERFETPEGTLSFSVMVFTPCALACLGTLVVRRYTVQGELGGSSFSRWATAGFFTLLWGVFLLMACLKEYEVLD